MDRKKPLESIGVALSVITIVCGGIAYLATQASNAAKATNCKGNIATIAALLRNYQRDYGNYPPRVVYDESGKPMHSWRIILARFSSPKEYKGYNLKEPWDSQNNIRFAAKIPNFLKCQNDWRSSEKEETSYVGINNGAWPEQFETEPSASDNQSKLLVMVVEMADSGILWTQPIDLDVETMSFKLNDFENPSVRSHDSIGPVVLDAKLTSERLDYKRANSVKDVVQNLITGIPDGELVREQLVSQGVFHRYE